jgi:hypothetical protein
MRRVLLLAIASCGLIAIGPGASLARSEHHHRHHGRHHARHHVRHTRRFGDLNGTSGNSGTPASPTTPTTPTTTPGAATIASFTNDVLTITLNDGSTVSGKVTNNTELECVGQGDNDGMNDNFRADGGPGPSGSGGDGDNDENEQNCGMAMLTQGATVDGAVLEISSAGATWARIELG